MKVISQFLANFLHELGINELEIPDRLRVVVELENEKTKVPRHSNWYAINVAARILKESSA